MLRVRGGAYATPTLDAEIRGLPGVERALATDLVYTTLRHDRWIDAALAPRLRDPDGLPPDVLDALRLGTADLLLRGTPRHAIDSWVELVKGRFPKLAGLTNAVLRRVAPPDRLDDATAVSLPPWLYDAFRAALGDDAERAARGMLEPAPLWVTALRGDARDLLEADGVDVTEGPLPSSFALQSRKPLRELSAFQQGVVQPQNPSASVPVRLLAPRPGEAVLELAAGRGVKTAQLAAAGARVTAVDIDPRKLAQAETALAKAGLEVEHRVADLRDPAAVRELPAHDAVLLDAPCTGTGTLRGHPEIKLRLEPGDVDALAAQQAALLDAAADRVRPGGRLVYAVCALTEAEGPKQIEAFLARNEAFRAEPAVPPEVSRLPSAAASVGSFLLPVDGLDGFYLARLRRAPADGDASTDATRRA